MKLYESRMAPNPRRVRIFLAEKGIEVPTIQLDIGKLEHQEPRYVAMNPMARVPFLELDDGRVLAESVAICRYFEGTHPDPPLMGVDPEDAAFVEMWNRRMEYEIYGNVAGCFRNSHPYFSDKIEQVPEYGRLCKENALARLAWLDEELGQRDYVAGDRFSIADITALVAVDFGAPSDIRIAPDQKHLSRWHAAVSSRPSAKA